MFVSISQKIITIFFHCLIIVRFGEKEIAKRKSLILQKKPMKIWDFNVDNIVISKLVETKTNSKYLIGIKFGKAIRPLVLTMIKTSGYVKTFKVEDKINKLMSFRIDDEKLLEKYKLFGLRLKT